MPQRSPLQRRLAPRPGALALLLAPLALGAGLALHGAPAPHAAPPPHRCTGDQGGLTLPPGFCATVFADNLGHVRHLVVATDGTVYANSWSGAYFTHTPAAPPGGFLVALKDTHGTGVADRQLRFGGTLAGGQHGGTGIALWHGMLFAEEHDTILRYALRPGQLAPVGAPATVLSGLPLGGDHPMHPFAIAGDGTLFVNSGSATNTCESPNRQPGAKGARPCVEALTRGGIWAYRADRTGQRFSPAGRWATGLRNSGGFTFDSSGRMFGVQHGRDQLAQNWPALYTVEQGVERPAEILYAPTKGADFGWPTCYYDGFQKRHVLAPEYGGDGGKTQGECAGKAPPVAAFPAHWAPNDVAIYTGHAFPAAYHDGAFIAFHGSWNRAPAPQDGYQIGFQPLRNGQAAGPWIRFADGFAGPDKEPGRALHRPAGLAVGPDGALYVADDRRGRIWRITYAGPADAPLVNAPSYKSGLSGVERTLPQPGHPVMVIDGVVVEPAVLGLGRRIYLGQEKNGTCAGCHGSDGGGSALGAALTGPTWLWSDGSLAGITHTIEAGVDHPKKATGAMPARGGAALSDADVKAVAAYVWTLRKGG
jgi:glucose/arabinose dehydrogenase/cytochrome c5